MEAEVPMELMIVAILVVVAMLGLISLDPRARWAHGLSVTVLCVALTAVALALALQIPPPDTAMRAAIGLATVAAATFMGWPVTEVVLSRALKMPPREPNADLPASGWVGLVERFGFSLALVLGLPEVAALIVGVKALGSYAMGEGEGNTTQAARVLGTLTSIAWALCVCAVYLVAAS
jgi:hypothetical protein